MANGDFQKWNGDVFMWLSMSIMKELFESRGYKVNQQLPMSTKAMEVVGSCTGWLK